MRSKQRRNKVRTHERCKEMQANIEAFAENSLGREETALFISHVSGCPDCRDELQTYYIVKYGLTDAPLPEDADEYEVKYLKDYNFHRMVEHVLVKRANELETDAFETKVSYLVYLVGLFVCLLTFFAMLVFEYV